MRKLVLVVASVACLFIAAPAFSESYDSSDETPASLPQWDPGGGGDIAVPIKTHSYFHLDLIWWARR